MFCATIWVDLIFAFMSKGENADQPDDKIHFNCKTIAVIYLQHNHDASSQTNIFGK